MIFSKHDIKKIDKRIRFVLDLIHYDVNHDLFLHAIDPIHLESLKKYATRMKLKMVKPKWAELMESGNGVIFTIQSNQFRHKLTPKMIDDFHQLAIENNDFIFDFINSNEKFVVCFVAEKPLENKIDQPKE